MPLNLTLRSEYEPFESLKPTRIGLADGVMAWRQVTRAVTYTSIGGGIASLPLFHNLHMAYMTREARTEERLGTLGRRTAADLRCGCEGCVLRKLRRSRTLRVTDCLSRSARVRVKHA